MSGSLNPRNWEISSRTTRDPVPKTLLSYPTILPVVLSRVFEISNRPAVYARQ
jgi:hypothetical protein